MKLTERQKRAIERNKKHGLLCACNKEMIPYYNEKGEEHGTKLVGKTLHGYDDCEEVP